MQTIDDHINSLLQSKRSVRFKELQRILFELGFQMRQQKRGGSHYVFKRPGLKDFIVLVSHGANDVIPEYQVRQTVKVLKQLKEQI